MVCELKKEKIKAWRTRLRWAGCNEEKLRVESHVSQRLKQAKLPSHQRSTYTKDPNHHHLNISYIFALFFFLFHTYYSWWWSFSSFFWASHESAQFNQTSRYFFFGSKSRWSGSKRKFDRWLWVFICAKWIVCFSHSL